MIGQTAYLLIKPYSKQTPAKAAGKGNKSGDKQHVEPSALKGDDPLVAAHRLPSPHRPSKEMLEGKSPEEKKEVQKMHNSFVHDCAEKYGKQLSKMAKTSRMLHTPPEGSKPFAKLMSAISAAKVDEFYGDTDFWKKITDDSGLTKEHFSKHTVRCFLAFKEMHKAQAANMFNTIATNWVAVEKGISSAPAKFINAVRLPDEKSICGICPSILALASPAFRKICDQTVYKEFLQAVKAKIADAKEKAGETVEAEEDA
jgi:hypothetical protein